MRLLNKLSEYVSITSFYNYFYHLFLAVMVLFQYILENYKIIYFFVSFPLKIIGKNRKYFIFNLTFI